MMQTYQYYGQDFFPKTITVMEFDLLSSLSFFFLNQSNINLWISPQWIEM